MFLCNFFSTAWSWLSPRLVVGVFWSHCVLWMQTCVINGNWPEHWYIRSLAHGSPRKFKCVFEKDGPRPKTFHALPLETKFQNFWNVLGFVSLYSRGSALLQCFSVVRPLSVCMQCRTQRMGLMLSRSALRQSNQRAKSRMEQLGERMCASFDCFQNILFERKCSVQEILGSITLESLIMWIEVNVMVVFTWVFVPFETYQMSN